MITGVSVAPEGQTRIVIRVEFSDAYDAPTTHFQSDPSESEAELLCTLVQKQRGIFREGLIRHQPSALSSLARDCGLDLEQAKAIALCQRSCRLRRVAA